MEWGTWGDSSQRRLLVSCWVTEGLVTCERDAVLLGTFWIIVGMTSSVSGWLQPEVIDCLPLSPPFSNLGHLILGPQNFFSLS